MEIMQFCLKPLIYIRRMQRIEDQCNSALEIMSYIMGWLDVQPPRGHNSHIYGITIKNS